MGRGDVSLACAQALLDALVEGGVRHACLSPGSRSTALALALARDDRVTVHVHLDERSGGFFALGLAKATGAPVAFACTSGTAAAEPFPAVIEASQSRTPLVLLTADRPPRLRGTGANQTIDQERLYGAYARASLEPPVPVAAGDVAAWREAGSSAILAALGPPAGPAHVNCPFDEPLTPEGEEVVAPQVAARAPTASPPHTGAPHPPVRGFRDRWAGLRGVVTIGSLRPPETLSLLSLGTLLGWPVLAEPLSGLRLDASNAGRALAAGQLLAGDDGWVAAQAPEIVLQVGATPTTRATQALVAAAEHLVVLDSDHLDPDPEHRASERLDVDPELFAAIAWDEREDLDLRPADAAWLEAWRAADLAARAALDRFLDAMEEPFEPRVARDLAAFVPSGAILFVGSSTPVRDLDLAMMPRRPPRLWTAADLVRFIANRGASGIDGSVATALGAAAAGQRPVYALLGDLTFLHDVGTLAWQGRRGLDAVLVVLRNGGGEIFSLLPQGDLPEHHDLFVTPHGLDGFADLCAGLGIGHTEVTRSDALPSALEAAARAGGIQVVDVEIDPITNREGRGELRAAVAG